jgi:hypothetical protein
MQKLDFLKRFGMALKAFSERERLKDELAATAEAKRAGLPLVLSMPHPQVATSLMTAAKQPHLMAVEAEKAWRACFPWWKRLLCA